MYLLLRGEFAFGISYIDAFDAEMHLIGQTWAKRGAHFGGQEWLSNEP